MSVSFYIKNKSRFLKYEKVLTISEIRDLFPLSIYNIDIDADDFDFNTSIENWQENYNCILFGVEDKSARGFEFSYNSTKNSYVIKEYTPASESDWLVVLEFMKVLAEKLVSKIIATTGEVFTSGTIENFDYKKDIKAGIKTIFNLLNEKDAEVSNIYGIVRPISFNKKIIERIVNSSDEIKEFSKFCEDIQYINAYSAKQSFVEDRTTKEEDVDKFIDLIKAL